MPQQLFCNALFQGEALSGQDTQMSRKGEWEKATVE